MSETYIKGYTKVQNKLTGMGFVLTCDRPVDPAKHSLRPGGFELSNGERFDFCASAGYRDDNDPCRVRFELKDFDDEYSEGKITREDISNNKFEEFYVYTGEAGDEIINVTGISNLEFEFDHAEVISLEDDNQLVKSANDSLEQSSYEEGKDL